MRPLTIQEVRRFDATPHQELLRWLSREVGKLDGGLKYHLERHELHTWKLLDPVMRGLRGASNVTLGRGREGRAWSGSARPREVDPPLLKCHQRRFPFCKLPPKKTKARKQEAAKARAEAAAKAKANAEKGERPAEKAQ